MSWSESWQSKAFFYHVGRSAISHEEKCEVFLWIYCPGLRNVESGPLSTAEYQQLWGPLSFGIVPLSQYRVQNDLLLLGAMRNGLPSSLDLRSRPSPGSLAAPVTPALSPRLFSPPLAIGMLGPSLKPPAVVMDQASPQPGMKSPSRLSCCPFCRTSLPSFLTSAPRYLPLFFGGPSCSHWISTRFQAWLKSSFTQRPKDRHHQHVKDTEC